MFSPSPSTMRQKLLSVSVRRDWVFQHHPKGLSRGPGKGFGASTVSKIAGIWAEKVTDEKMVEQAGGGTKRVKGQRMRMDA